MKNILIPTDFSSFAEAAIKTGIQLASIIQVNLIIFHSADLPAGWVDRTPEAKEKDPAHLEIEGSIQFRLQEIDDLLRSEGISGETLFAGGNFIINIKSVIVNKNIDLILMGSHGASGKEEFFIGSNTQKVVRKVHIPVMVVKQPVTDLSFKNVLFTTNLNEADLEAFTWFVDFVRPFHPDKMHIMVVDTSSYFKQPTPRMKESLIKFEELSRPLKCQTHFFKDYSVEAGIRHFSKDYGIDLIGISNHERHALKRMFQGSNVELLVNHSDIPVLSIDY